MAGPMFDKDHLPDGEWAEYRKHAITKAVRVEGPFVVNTSEGVLTCQDGYLAIDARGYPYPIATEEFELIYQPVEV